MNALRSKATLVQRMDGVIAILRTLCAIAGADVLDPNYSPNWRTAFGVFILILHHIAHFHTLYFYRNDVMMALRCLCTLAFGTQGTVKFASALIYKYTYRSIHSFIRNVYVENENGSLQRKEALAKTLNECNFYRKIIKRVTILCVGVLFLYPVAFYLYFKERDYFFGAYLPNTDPKSVTGYFINIVYQLSSIIFGIFGTLAADTALAFMIIHIQLFSRLFKISLDETEELLNDKDNGLIAAKAKLLNTLKMHQDIINYRNLVEKCFTVTIFVQIVFSALPIALVIFNIFFTNWIAGFGFICYFFMQFFIYCLIGTLLEMTNEEITDAIYNFKWYQFPINCQKLVLLALLQSQNAKSLMIGAIAPLNVATGATVMKTIYSYLMLVINFLK